ncbi:MAG TPA: MobQ family relaxase [Steroidobacteraceae bacterium]|nr:MobQ family relaxase [Steroidobacteraceae bacterium]
MAIFYMQISSLARSAGRRATAAAAYRSGERIRDERTGELINYSRRRDILHTEIMLPSQFDGAPLPWARNRERLWNTAEHAEKRHNARVAREFQVMLPAELDPARRIALARNFAREVAERYKVAVDLAVHEPRPDGDARNFHAHLLTTTREVTPAGLAAKTGLDMHPQERRRHGLPDHRQEFINIRERWASLANQALRDANIEARIDHRSLAAQGIDREPQPAIPIMHLKMERRGLPSEVADRLRAAYRERVALRLEKAATPDAAARVPETGIAGTRAGARTAGTSVEEVRRRARAAWLELRSAAQPPGGAKSLEQAQAREESLDTTALSRTPQDDLAL